MSFSLNKSIPDIAIINLHLEYQHHWLFDQFNLTLPAGSWSCILGTSGVGKSTLLKLLAGLPTGVDHPVDSQVIVTSDRLPLTGRVAYMAQQDSLMPWLTVLENCLLGYRLRQQSVSCEEKSKALALLSRVELGDAIHLYPTQLSGGMRQRVALVRTLLEERPVVLMDEPFSSLDVITRLKLQDLAAELLAARTVLLVTHDPLEALRLADRVYVLSGVPAVLSEPLIPDGPRPRPPKDPHVLKIQGQLLDLLAGSNSR